MACGFGALSLYFAAAGARVTGIDSNGRRLEVGRAVARRAGLPLRLAQGRMEHGPLDESAFDVVVINNALCYLVAPDDRRDALEGARRALRPAGTVIVREPNRWHPLDQFTRIPLIQLLPPDTAVRVAALAGRPRSRCRVVSPRRMRAELSGAGFEDVAQPASPARSRSRAPKRIARYQHAVGRRRS
jgi:SAM-dependent methyltransferase